MRSRRRSTARASAKADAAAPAPPVSEQQCDEVVVLVDDAAPASSTLPVEPTVLPEPAAAQEPPTKPHTHVLEAAGTPSAPPLEADASHVVARLSQLANLQAAVLAEMARSQAQVRELHARVAGLEGQLHAANGTLGRLACMLERLEECKLNPGTSTPCAMGSSTHSSHLTAPPSAAGGLTAAQRSTMEASRVAALSRRDGSANVIGVTPSPLTLASFSTATQHFPAVHLAAGRPSNIGLVPLSTATSGIGPCHGVCTDSETAAADLLLQQQARSLANKREAERRLAASTGTAIGHVSRAEQASSAAASVAVASSSTGRSQQPFKRPKLLAS